MLFGCVFFSGVGSSGDFVFPILILLFDFSVSASQARIEFANFCFVTYVHIVHTAQMPLLCRQNENFHLQVLLLRRQYEVPVASGGKLLPGEGISRKTLIACRHPVRRGPLIQLAAITPGHTTLSRFLRRLASATGPAHKYEGLIGHPIRCGYPGNDQGGYGDSIEREML